MPEHEPQLDEWARNANNLELLDEINEALDAALIGDYPSKAKAALRELFVRAA